MSKLIVIVGITGNQGHSVAQRFLKDPNYRIRGLTRNPSSPRALALQSQGIEILSAELDDVSTLIPAFAGANLIFTVTNYWEPFFRPDCRARATEQGISCRKFAYDVEYQQGKNIADAAAQTVDTLDENGLIASTLSSARKCSNATFQELYHFDAKADVFPGYVEERYPALARKMSCVQTGYFMTSYRLAPELWLAKDPSNPDRFSVSFPMPADKPVPHLDVNADVGPFVWAVSRMAPGKAYMCAGTSCSWTEYCKAWSKVTGKECTYEEITLEETINRARDKDAGKEIGDMYLYSGWPGYDGGDESLLWDRDLQKAGIDCPMTPLEDFMKRQDWSEVLNR